MDKMDQGTAYGQQLRHLSVVAFALLLALPFIWRTCHAQQRDVTGAALSSEAGERWVGTRYPPLPGGVTSRGGATIGNPFHTRFAIDDVVAGGYHMLWLTRRTGNSTDGVPYRVVTDVLVLLVDTSAVYTPMYGGLCGTLRPERPARLTPTDVAVDPEIVALVHIEKGEWVDTDIERAWRANRDTGQFVPVSPDSLACFRETPPSYSG